MDVIDVFNNVQWNFLGFKESYVDVSDERQHAGEISKIPLEWSGYPDESDRMNVNFKEMPRKILLKFVECYYESYHQQVNSLSDFMKMYSSGIDNI